MFPYHEPKRIAVPPDLPSDHGGGFPRSVLLLNNYARTGIGDFGEDLASALRGLGVNLRVEETSPNGEGFSRELRLLRQWEGPVIANIGLTAWGSSKPRNLRGFIALGRQGRQRATVVILHHVIEMIADAESGYPLGPLTRVGARFAVSRLRPCHLVVLSPRIAEILTENYRISPVHCAVSPCKFHASAPEASPAAVQKRIVSLGYLAPYKGLDLFVETAREMSDHAEFVIIGQPHRVLSQDPNFRAWVEGFRTRARAAGVALPGFVPEPELLKLLSSSHVAILPYTSSSGASAAFSTLAASGLPVVATDLPEFRYVRDMGAGIILCPSEVGALRRSVESLLNDEEKRMALVSRQIEFARAHTWEAFARKLLEIVE